MESLDFLDSKRLSPEEIHILESTNSLSGRELAISSIGRSYRAAITPYYSGFQFGWGLTERLASAVGYNRPLSEYELRLNRHRNVATVIGRWMKSGDVDHFVQAGAQFQIEDGASLSTTWDLIDRLKHSEDSEMSTALSGLVAVTHARLSSNNPNWRPEEIDPETAVAVVSDGIANEEYIGSR